MNQIPWNKTILDEFLRLSCLTDDEHSILRMRIDGKTRVYIAMKLNMSPENVDRIIRIIRNKYDGCRQYSDILPERRKSSRELKKIQERESGA